MRTKSKLAYFAGLIDGDGTICISVAYEGTKQQVTKPYMSIGCTTPEICKWAAKHFGGSQFQYERPDPKHKDVYHWKIASNEALTEIVSQIRPYLLIKRPQADILLEHLALGRKACPEERLRLAKAIQHANQNHNDYPPFKRNLSRQEANAYIAGLIDSEGSLKINPSTRSLQPKIEIPNTNANLIAWLHTHTQGRQYLKEYENPNHSDLHTWVLYDKKEIEKFLLSILPYIVLKREHALLVLQGVRTPNKDREPIYLKLQSIQNSRKSTQTTNTLDTSQEVKIESAPA